MSTRKQFALLVPVVSLLSSVSCAENPLVYPCVDFEAIRWVRDSTFCDQYYICHFGQPLAMPACPSGQVWSNGAVNCVPKDSVWDDCYNGISSTQRDTTQVQQNTLKTNQTSTVTGPVQLNPTYNNIVISIKQMASSIASPTFTTAQTHLPNNNQNVARPEYHISAQTKEHGVKAPESWYKHSNSITTLKNTTIITSTPTSTSRTSEMRTSSPVFTKSSRSQTRMTSPATLPRGSRLYEVMFEERTRLLKHRLNATYQLFKVDPGTWGRLILFYCRYRYTRSQLVCGKVFSVTVSWQRNHECFHQPGALLPHPHNCHWYINCSLANLDDLETKPEHREGEDSRTNSDEGSITLLPFRVRHAGVFVWECRYPQLFDEATGRCREFINVDCKSRFQPVDQCEYTAKQCRGGRCVPCERRFGRCRGRQNGVYPLHHTRWTPVFVTCYQERETSLRTSAPRQLQSSPQNCLTVPKQHGGFLPDCSTRPDGYYPDEQGHFRGYDECPPGSVFDPTIPACQPYSYASKPCGEGQAPLCGGKMDGLYADPFGRCTNYFQCTGGVFQQYLTCDLGIFDPLTQRCVVSAELTVRPCGLQPSPCEALPTGVYPDQATGCQHFIECHHGNMLTNGTCPKGTVFSAITGDLCLTLLSIPTILLTTLQVAVTCLNTRLRLVESPLSVAINQTGRYPALARGCSFFYECHGGEFLSLRRCTEADGGIFFNPDTGTCDYPQNICPPCGYRWWGCADLLLPVGKCRSFFQC
ncbi:unnamed protein product [Candidula unifasciata]|uniref:Chitin-binding type-2 domain-containing protein n=1 Tax=Candidula unifasciata TaxID=100452 RepID=A0A8S3ZLJ4_9EUPU|nr:unnamed protein product [Candidula unifasciata]